MNSLLHYSTANKDATFPFWDNVNGTFGVVVYNALKAEGFNPAKVFISIKGEVRTVKYNGHKKTFRHGFTANKIIDFVKSV